MLHLLFSIVPQFCSAVNRKINLFYHYLNLSALVFVKFLLYNDYKFDGWYNYKGEDLDNITSNLNFYATYETIPHSYTARFYNHDGFLLQSSIVKKRGHYPLESFKKDSNAFKCSSKAAFPRSVILKVVFGLRPINCLWLSM